MIPAGAAWTIYGAAVQVADALLPVAARFSPKLARGLEARRGLLERLLAAAPQVEGCWWFHVTSVGEYEQARPLLRGLRERGLGPLVVTHFSPSGRDYARTHPEADLHDYLPLDRPADLARLVEAWRPRALLFVKYDVWPHLVRTATDHGVPTLLVSAALPAASRRLAAPARPFFRSVFNRLAGIGTGSAADRRRFVERLGVTAPVEVTGDTRAEQVLRRFAAAADDPRFTPLQTWGGRRLILGSTWPPDEALWRPVLPDLHATRPELRTVLVPHEPTPSRVRSLLDACSRDGLSATTWSLVLDDPLRLDAARVLVVDAVGVLAGLYHTADLAYVGGSFTTGVHSTLEPAAAAVPVGFGPRIANAEEALTLAAGTAGTVLRRPDEALAWARSLLENDGARRRAGAEARAVVDAQVGAAARTLDFVLERVGDHSA